MSNFISYINILQDRELFRSAGGANDQKGFNAYDTPGQKYFKIFFYFNNGDSDNNLNISSGNGLLTPTWLVPNVDENSYYLHNSAWSYLKMNAEDDRAKLLENFVNLLSNISAESPWYFSEISGLDAALERKQVMSENFTIDPTRNKITIKCLPDAYDDRIGTLLDLYRAITWSWSTKREIIPANLRKFDMGIFIFETPTIPFHIRNNNGEKEASGIGDGINKTTYKYLELHNCEFDYSSSKQNYANLNNKDGFQTEYNIDIYFDDCYETRYNEFLMSEFGDMILFDIKSDTVINDDELSESNNASDLKTIKKESKAKKILNKLNNVLDYDFTEMFTPWGLKTNDTGEYWDNNLGRNGDGRLLNYPPRPETSKGNFLNNVKDQLIATGRSIATSIIKKAVLGNLYTFSLTRISDQVRSLVGGDLISTARNVNNYINDNKKRDTGLSNNSLFDKKKIKPTVKYIGNLYKGNTIVDNI